MGDEMGNNNTSGLREGESSKLEDNGRSSVEFLGDNGKDDRGENKTDSLSNCHEAKELEKTQNGTHHLDVPPETEQKTDEPQDQTDEQHSSVELNLSELNGPKNRSATVDHLLLETQKSVAEGEHESSVSETENTGIGVIAIEPGEETILDGDVCASRSIHGRVSTEEMTVEEERGCQEENVSEEEKIDVKDEISAATEEGAEEKLCIDDIYASRSVSSEETDEKTVRETTLLCAAEDYDVEDKMSVETQTDSADEVLLEKGFFEEQREIQTRENGREATCLEDNHLLGALVAADEEEPETDDELIKQEIKPINQKSSMVTITHYRSQSLPVRLTKRFLTDSFVQPTEHCLGQSSQSEINCFSSNKTRLKRGEPENFLEDETAGSNEAQEDTETNNENTTEADPRTRSPSFGSDLRIEARTEELSEETPLLYQDKAETYEEKTIMLEKSDSLKSRVEFLWFLKEKEEVGTEEITITKPKQEDKKKKKKKSAEDEETESSGDNLRDKKASLDSMNGKERRQRRVSLFNTCLCCDGDTVVN